MNQKIKISQLPAKGSNLAAQDLLEIAEFTGTGYVSKSITGAEIAAGATAGFVPETRTLTINGVTQDLSANRTFTISTGITIGSTAIASGVVGRVLFEGAGNVVQESSSLFWDNTNGRLGIGTSTAPSGSVYIDNSGNDVKQHLVLKNSDAGSGAQVHLDLHNNVAGSTYSSGASLFFCSSTHAAPYASALGFWNYLNGPIALATNSAERMRVAASGNVLINTTTDAGFRLDVNGTARVQGQLTLNNNVLITSGEKYIFFNTTSTFLAGVENPTVYFGYNFGTRAIHIGSLGSGNILFRSSGNVCLDQATSKLLIGTTTDAGFRLDVNGTARIATSLEVGGTSSGSLTTSVVRCNFLNTANNSFSVIQFQAANGNATFFQSVSIGSGANPLASAQLEVTSTTKGFLPPRMTTTQKNAIASPAAGLMVYDTTLNVISYYNGSMWI